MAGAPRRETTTYNEPVSIYEVHLGSWRRRPEEGNRALSYDEFGDNLSLTQAKWVSRTSS